MTVAVLSNNPPTDAEIYAEKVAAYEAAAAEFAVITDDNAARANDHATFGQKIAKEIEDTRKREKEPHLEAGRAVDAAYSPLVSKADAIRKAIADAIQKHLKAKKAEAERIAREKAEAARKIEEEARAKAAAEAAAAAPQDDVFAEFMAATAPAPEEVETAKAEAAEAVKAVAAAARVDSASGWANSVGIRKAQKVAQITDLAAAAAFYAGRQSPELEAVILKIANAEIRAAKGAAVNIPGILAVEKD